MSHHQSMAAQLACPQIVSRFSANPMSSRLQRAAFCRRRCSLAFRISLRSPTGRISQTLPYFRDGCWDKIW